MSRKLFVTLPVTDVAASVAFYEAIGMVPDSAFPRSEDSAAMHWGDEVCFMLASRAAFGRITARPIADTQRTVANVFALVMESPKAVDAVLEAALAAGGRKVHGPEFDGFMYSVGFEDPDGHGFGPFYVSMRG